MKLRLLALIALAGCSSESRTKAPPAVAAAPAPEASAPHALPAVRSLADRLRAERADRPAIALPAERVLAALGDALPAPRQYLAATAHARYCIGGTTTGGLGIAICEYATPDDAARGRAFVESTYAALSSIREIHVRGATTLTVTTPTAAAHEDARRIGDLFTAL